MRVLWLLLGAVAVLVLCVAGLGTGLLVLEWIARLIVDF
jgi:hypothetical protein